MNKATSSLPFVTKEIKLTPAETARFWSKVNKDGPTMPHMDTSCWVWLGCKRGKYGAFSLARKLVSSHRVALTVTCGPLPERVFVLHRCDTPSCCRPDHLFLGTAADNMRDMAAKGRKVVALGEAHGISKLTEYDVVEIRTLYAAGGISLMKLSRRFGVQHSVIRRIVRREIWRHVP